jgi:hypothetical protein
MLIHCLVVDYGIVLAVYFTTPILLPLTWRHKFQHRYVESMILDSGPQEQPLRRLPPSSP